MIKNENKDFIKHFPRKISKEMADFATNVALLDSRYLFIKRNRNIQYAYCTHCKKDYMTSEILKHKQEAVCEHCASKCEVRSHGMGRKYLRDEAYFVFYEKSVVDPQAIVAKGVLVRRDYSGDYHKVETEYILKTLYLFQQGRSEQMTLEPYYDFENKEVRQRWAKRRKVHSLCNTSMLNVPKFCDIESIRSSVKGTLFKYSCWQYYANADRAYPSSYSSRSVDMVEFFNLASQYPCIEYLIKLGFREIVEDKLFGHRTYGVINWRGKNIQKVLKLSKQEINEIREQGISINCRVLHYYHFSKSHGSDISFSNAVDLAGINDSDVFKEVLVYANVGDINKYLLKQMRARNEGERTYYNSSSLRILYMWRDYIEDCKTLGLDLSLERVLYPNNLYKAHEKTTKRIKLREDRLVSAKIAKRLPSLKHYIFESKDLIVRPAKSSIELFEEGKVLEHCVGGYAKRYSEGKSDILVVRKRSALDKPFYTLEIKNNEITQIYGYKHCGPTKQVKRFIDSFEREVLKKIEKTRSKKIEEAAI